ncbi:hypothetical protein QYF36_016502 [Acer negundo]|nr:hypothetical protein QYF36_016502 [Acer negundo]
MRLPLAHRNIEAMEARSFKRLIRSSRVIVVKMEYKKPSCLCHLQYNIPRIHVVFAFLIPLLMGLLQVDYQTKKSRWLQFSYRAYWVGSVWVYGPFCLS